MGLTTPKPSALCRWYNNHCARTRLPVLPVIARCCRRSATSGMDVPPLSCPLQHLCASCGSTHRDGWDTPPVSADDPQGHLDHICVCPRPLNRLAVLVQLYSVKYCVIFCSLFDQYNVFGSLQSLCLTACQCALQVVQQPLYQDSATRFASGSRMLQEICHFWNGGQCVNPPLSCPRQHLCASCGSTHHRARDGRDTPVSADGPQGHLDHICVCPRPLNRLAVLVQL